MTTGSFCKDESMHLVPRGFQIYVSILPPPILIIEKTFEYSDHSEK